MKLLTALILVLSVANPTALSQTGGAMDDGDEDLFYLEEEDDAGNDLFEKDAAARGASPRAILLEPAGLSVLPVLSYGLGVAHELKGIFGEGGAPFTLRARYARGSATMGEIYAVTEMTNLELLWAFHPWLYLSAGPSYRNVRASLKEGELGIGTSSTSVAGVTVAFGLQRPLGTYLLGCDVVGYMAPVGKARRRGLKPSELDDRNSHVGTLDRAAEGRSVSVLRLYFGPRF